MKIVKVTYTVKAAFAEENQENAKQFILDLKKRGYSGIRYFSFLGEDGKTFTHLAIFEQDELQKILLALPSFKEFQAKRDESGLEAAPTIETIRLVASSFDLFNNQKILNA